MNIVLRGLRIPIESRKLMRKLLGWISLWLSVGIVMLIGGEVMLRYPCNHGAGFYCYLYPVYGLIILSGFYGFILRVSKIGFFMSLLCLILILISDLFNVYVDYDVWTRRGMPDWGCPTFGNSTHGQDDSFGNNGEKRCNVGSSVLQQL